MDERNLVSCRNINIIAQYVKEQLGSDAMLLLDWEYPPEYLKNEHHWISLSLYNDIMDRAIDLLKDEKAPYKMGFSAVSLGSWGFFNYLQEIFRAIVYGPLEAYRKAEHYNPYFNKTKDMIVCEARDGHCLMKIRFKNGVDPVDDFHSETLIEGLFASIPTHWHLPSASIEAYTKEYDLRRLLLDVGKVSSQDIDIEGASFLLRGKVIGTLVQLTDTEHTVCETCEFSGYREASSTSSVGDVGVGIRITTDVEISKRLILRAGEIYNAPYFLYHITWQPLSLIKKLYYPIWYSLSAKQAYVKGMETSLETIRHYVETLEEKVIERTRQLHKAKSEAEYWRDKADQLLSTMLPPDIVKAMMEGKLRAQEIEGTVMYTDLADFTSYSKSISPQVIEKQLTEYFTEMSDIIMRHGGWVNKFLGDGILVIYGLNGDPNAVYAAANAAIEMDRVIDKYPWRTRIGIATGPFVTGEFGSDTLRRFDCIGHTMNLGSRLQGLADSGQTLVCATTHALLEKRGYGLEPARMVYAKGIGDILAYPLISEPKLTKRASKRASSAKKRIV